MASTTKGASQYRSINAVSNEVSNDKDSTEKITSRTHVDSSYIKVLSARRNFT